MSIDAGTGEVASTPTPGPSRRPTQVARTGTPMRSIVSITTKAASSGPRLQSRWRVTGSSPMASSVISAVAVSPASWSSSDPATITVRRSNSRAAMKSL